MDYYDVLFASILSGGGGGEGILSTDAILRVQAPAGSTVTIEKGGIIKSDEGHANAFDSLIYDYYFIIHQSQFDSVNAWTVTATLDTDTSSQTIIIDSSDEYDVELNYFLPPEYKLVQYLESSGTQYIDTGYIIKQNSKIEFVGQLLELAQGQTFFEVTSSSTNRCLVAIPVNYTDQLSYIGGANGTQKVTSSSYSKNTDISVSIYPDFVVNNANNGSVSVPTQTKDFYIFAGNDNGTVRRQSKVRIKWFKITASDNTVELELYPCYRKSDSVAGLYDVINGMFYTNAGSGTFIVGE